MMRWLKEVGLVLGQSLRLLFAGKQTLLLVLGSLMLLVALLAGMDSVKEEKSKIAVGIANEDGSPLSLSVIDGMQQKELYEITTGTEKDLVEQLKRGELAAVCVLNEGFAEDIFNGKTNHLVTIYETKDKTALLLGDILAGVMMQEICTAKSYQTLLDYAEKSGRQTEVSLEEYRKYVTAVLEEGRTEFSFDVTYVAGNGTLVQKPSQSVVYQQAIFAVFALMAGLISIYAVLPFWQFCHDRVSERMKTMPMHGSSIYVGSALAGMVIPVFFGMLFLACLLAGNPVEFSKFLSILICTVVYICVIVCMMLLAAVLIRNQMVYQMGMLAMILIFGVFGLVSLIDGLLVPEGTATWVPNGWYVRRMTELF